jgi:hypothetical protein
MSLLGVAGHSRLEVGGNEAAADGRLEAVEAGPPIETGARPKLIVHHVNAGNLGAPAMTAPHVVEVVLPLVPMDRAIVPLKLSLAVGAMHADNRGARLPPVTGFIMLDHQLQLAEMASVPTPFLVYLAQAAAENAVAPDDHKARLRAIVEISHGPHLPVYCGQ